MTQLMKASNQWATRPDDERYTSLLDMQEFFHDQRNHSREVIVSSKKLTAVPGADHRALTIEGPSGHGYEPTHFSFSQLASLAEAPAGYLRKLPAEIAADCINVGLKMLRNQEEVGVLLHSNGKPVLRAATGPRYGRIWNSQVVDALVQNFGDGVTGAWKVPGEFGRDVRVTKDNTTLYAGDRDMFVFLADEKNRIEMPNRRAGRSGSLARGFFCWNSEVGSSTFGLGTFLFDFACSNRIVWGAEDYKEVRIRHSSGAPDRWIDEVRPALESYRKSSDVTIVQAIADARAHKLEEDLDEFLATRFGKRLVDPIKRVHMLEEDRPIENRWDAVVGATAVARSIKWQDDRVELERQAGKLLKAA